MRAVFGGWKYIFKNLWYVLPFALVPAVFLALSLDYTAISALVSEFFAGNPRAGFLDYFRAWSFIGTDWLGAIFSVCAYLSVSVFMALMLALVEKHMRIGKRTLSGAFSQLGNLLFSSFGITFAYLAMYEIWAIVVSAVMFAVAAVGGSIVVYVLDVVVFLFFIFALLYLATTLYLWFPCKQVTGFGAYDTFLYSYQLMTGIRWRIIFSFMASCVALLVIVAASTLLPQIVFLAIMFVMFVFLFLNFCIRMETTYFYADKLDREDLLRSYRELYL